MNIFRSRRQKKAGTESAEPELDIAAALPSENDFRTSLIMPNLSARFSLLREQDDPASILGKACDDSVLAPHRKSRLADFGYTKTALADIAEVSSIHSSIRPSASLFGDNCISDTESLANAVAARRANGGPTNILFGGRQRAFRVRPGKSGLSGRATCDEDPVLYSSSSRMSLETEQENQDCAEQIAQNRRAALAGLEAASVSSPPLPTHTLPSKSPTITKTRKGSNSSARNVPMNTTTTVPALASPKLPISRVDSSDSPVTAAAGRPTEAPAKPKLASRTGSFASIAAPPAPSPKLEGERRALRPMRIAPNLSAYMAPQLRAQVEIPASPLRSVSSGDYMPPRSAEPIPQPPVEALLVRANLRQTGSSIGRPSPRTSTISTANTEGGLFPDREVARRKSRDLRSKLSSNSLAPPGMVAQDSGTGASVNNTDMMIDMLRRSQEIEASPYLAAQGSQRAGTSATFIEMEQGEEEIEKLSLEEEKEATPKKEEPSGSRVGYVPPQVTEQNSFLDDSDSDDVYEKRGHSSGSDGTVESVYEDAQSQISYGDRTEPAERADRADRAETESSRKRSESSERRGSNELSVDSRQTSMSSKPDSGSEPGVPWREIVNSHHARNDSSSTQFMQARFIDELEKRKNVIQSKLQNQAIAGANGTSQSASGQYTPARSRGVSPGPSIAGSTSGFLRPKTSMQQLDKTRTAPASTSRSRAMQIFRLGSRSRQASPNAGRPKVVRPEDISISHPAQMPAGLEGMPSSKYTEAETDSPVTPYSGGMPYARSIAASSTYTVPEYGQDDEGEPPLSMHPAFSLKPNMSVTTVGTGYGGGENGGHSPVPPLTPVMSPPTDQERIRMVGHSNSMLDIREGQMAGRAHVSAVSLASQSQTRQPGPDGRPWSGSPSPPIPPVNPRRARYGYGGAATGVGAATSAMGRGATAGPTGVNESRSNSIFRKMGFGRSTS